MKKGRAIILLTLILTWMICSVLVFTIIPLETPLSDIFMRVAKISLSLFIIFLWFFKFQDKTRKKKKDMESHDISNHKTP